MRRVGLSFAAGWLLAAALVTIVPGAVAADEPRPAAAAREDRMAAIVAAVRAEEARYKDIEYVARITAREDVRKDPDHPSDVTTMATRRVVFQGDRTYFRLQSYERMLATRYRREEVSAYDGERTRTVVADICANIHLGRFRHPDIAPAHSLPLSHYGINFPLSVYLGGTKAIQAHFRYPPEMVGTMPYHTFRMVEVRLEGEEPIDGLRCVKVRVDRRDDPADRLPDTRLLWLAPERNYHCVKEQDPWYEMRVRELRELAPGVWFPAKITVDQLQAGGPDNAPKRVIGHIEAIVETVNLAPHHDIGFFRDVAIPADLPAFTIKDWKLVGSMPSEPPDDDGRRKKLAELAVRVAAEEKRYDNIEVKARTVKKMSRSATFANIVMMDEIQEERSIVRGDLAYYTFNLKMSDPGGWQGTKYRTIAYDGQWTRSYSGKNPENELLMEVGAVLRRGRGKNGGGNRDGISVHRPHTLIQRDGWISRSLGDMLTSRADDQIDSWTRQFRYCGEEEVDGHPCVRLRGAYAFGERELGTFTLYLATDRNHIPIRIERHAAPPMINRLLPVEISRCDDFREIAPGLWYPFRVTEVDLTGMSRVQGWIVPLRRRDTAIESASSAARIDETVFRDVVAPAGSEVRVVDERGNDVARFQQAEDGVPSLTLKRFLELSSQAQPGPDERQARQKALDALIGKPAPEFPLGAAWLNGRPLTWLALRGKVVVLGFWAEWSDAGRDDLARLNRRHQDRAQGGLAVVGVHPPGSEPAAIKKVIDALHLEFPVCVDAPAAEGASAWGELFDRFAVRSILQAVAVDREGKVVAGGRLEDVLARAEEQLQKGR